MKENKESIRLFENNFLESLSHVHPIVPLLMWGPVVAYLLYLSLIKYEISILGYSILFFIALLVWTLTEYLLHKYVFHFPAKSKIGKKFIFLFHGIHHDAPQDATRLVMPPVPAVLIMSMIFGLFSLIVPQGYLEAFMAFFVVGYLCYDYIHYATHHFKMTSKVGRYLRNFHLKHHYSHLPEKYGVSNPLWDYVFNTVNVKNLGKKETSS